MFLLTKMTQPETCEDFPMSREWECSYEKYAQDISETTAEVDLDPECDPDNYTCWTYEEYKQYMRETFCYIPEGFWEWFNFDDMLFKFWKDETYDIVYHDGKDLQLMTDETSERFKDKKGLFIVQYGLGSHPFQ